MVPKIDKYGNLVYTQTGLVYTSGVDSTLQTLANRLRLLKKESIYHPDDGMEYHTLIPYNNPALLTKEVTSELKKDKRVIYTHITTKNLKGEQLALNIQVKSENE